MNTDIRKTTRGTWRSWRIVRWENGRPVKIDRKTGKLYQAHSVYAVNGMKVTEVAK